jgi:predicted RNA-binding Zn-ribbon protein involved in translation (DUF1610 family)
MKTRTLKIYGAALAALVFATASLQAGPGPQQVYTPVKTYAAAEALKPDTKIAVTCPACGAMSVSSVDKSKSHMHSLTCTVCKHSFELEPVAGGKATAGKLVCKDTSTGKKMPLQMCAQMHR